eukprot:TRINITY_DN67402_c1_g1_i1.p1 TRINITY_DN67402_c1_g1~~TRINITY_DN67402_c1_g1_i1.p1  ORF type:complete len:818 (-),score=128.30 TRINITY_DN67402_c1_g1_i1:87-2540(-)
MHNLKPLGKGGLRAPRRNPGATAAPVSGPSAIDNAAITVLRSDLLVVQRRIDMLRREPRVISAKMQDQEGFLFALPPISEGETHLAVKVKLYEALLHRVRELCGMLLVITGRDPRTANLIPKDIPPLRPALPTATELVKRPHPPPGKQGSPRHPAPLPLAPGQCGPIGIPSFVDLLMCLSEAVEIVTQAKDEESGPPLLVIIQNLENQKKAMLEDHEKKMKEQKESMIIDHSKKIEQMIAKHKKEVQKLTDTVEDLRAHITKLQDKTHDKKREQGISREQYLKELRELNDANKRLQEESDSLKEKFEITQAQYQAGVTLAFAGLNKNFLQEVGLSIHVPELETETFERAVTEDLEQLLAKQPQKSSSHHPASPNRLSVMQTQPRSISPTALFTSPVGINTKLKDKKDIQIAELQQMLTTMRLHVATLQATLKQQNNVYHQIATQVPKLLQKSMDDTARAQKDAQHAQLLLKTNFEDKKMDELMWDRKLQAKDADIQELQQQLDDLIEERKEDSKLVTQHLKEFVPQVATPGLVKPESINMRMNTLELELTRRHRQNDELREKIKNLEADVQSRDQEISSLQSLIADLQTQVEGLQNDATVLSAAADESSSTAALEHKRNKYAAKQLAKMDDDCSHQFEKIKVLELSLTKANSTIAQWKRENTKTQKQLEEERETSKIAVSEREKKIEELNAELDENAKKHAEVVVGLEKTIVDWKNTVLLEERHTEKMQKKVLEIFDIDKRLLRAQYVTMQQKQQSHNLTEVAAQLKKLDEQIQLLVKRFAGGDRWPVPHLNTVKKEAKFLYDLVNDQVELIGQEEE